MGNNAISQANPIQAAFASGAAYIGGDILLFMVDLFAPAIGMEYYLYIFASLFLIGLGAIAAKTGGSSIGKAVMRITFWGAAAMGLTTLVGYLFGINVG